MATKTRLATLTTVKNMDRAIKFYTKKLGAKLDARAEGEMKNMWAGLTLLGHDVWLVAPAKREKRELAYTTFLVANIKSFVKKLQKNGIRFEKAEVMGESSRIDGPIAFESFGASAFFKDSEGNLLMVWQNFPPM